MIEFTCKNCSLCDIDLIKKMDFSELLKEECYFSIIIDDETFFEEPLFPIHEFIYFYIKWNKNDDFEYVSLETEDNPLISFEKQKNGWIMKSTWEKFACNRTFTLYELTSAVEKMLK